MSILLNWSLLALYGAVLYWIVRRTTPDRVSAEGFFQGESNEGREPGFWLLVSSAAITWIFAKSIDNSASLSKAFGIWGDVGYTIYYFSFITAAVAIYVLRARWGFRSIPEFLATKYGTLATKLFLVAVAIRLFNEVWSNTKVFSLYFGAEGSAGYWLAAILVTVFTAYYSLWGGLRSSLLTDSIQMVLAAILLTAILAALTPEFLTSGLPQVNTEARQAGLTFCCLALVQVFSYPFHDPVLTDRAFITSPRAMLRGFITAGFLSGGFIFLFGFVGIYSNALGLEGNPSQAVPAAIGLPMLLVFNAIMLASAGSTLDSTFASTAKLTARDWNNQYDRPTEGQTRFGRWAIAAISVLGNLPLLSIYLGDRIGPAIILATTISGTMVIGFAPIFLLSFLRSAGKWSFYLAFFPGLIFGVLIVLENALQVSIFPQWIAIGSGQYADDLGVNLYGSILCTLGYLAGMIFEEKSQPRIEPGNN